MSVERSERPEPSSSVRLERAPLPEVGPTRRARPFGRGGILLGACAIVVAGWAGGSCGSSATWASKVAVLATGTLQVTVTGLPSLQPNGGSAVAQRTDSAGAPITINVSAAGIGFSSNVPAGTYDVTYTPPSGTTVSGSNPVTGVVVPEGGAVTAVFTVTVVAGAGALRVTVSGLTGSRPNGGSAVAQRTDSAGTPINIAVSAAGSGASSAVPAGTYSVTYTPPSGFVVTGTNTVAGLVVAAGGVDTASFTVAGIPGTGTIQVAVTGLSGPLANGGSAVAQRTDSAGTVITINVSAAGLGSATSVPTGIYSVNYTPPAGWSVGSGNPVAGLTVTAGGTATASFAAVVTGSYLTPDILNNASFEPGELTGLNGVSVSGDGWSGFSGGTMASAVNTGVSWTPIPVYRVIAANETPSVAPAPAGQYVVEATLSTNTTTNGSNGPFRYFFGPGNLSELWVRFYFYLSTDWSVNSFWKFAIYRYNGGNGGGLDLNTGGLNFYSPRDCLNNYRFFVPIQNIPLGQWNSIEYHYSRNDVNPYAEFWFNGARVTHADGQWPGGPTCQWWANNVLYLQRGSGSPGDPIGNGIGWAETINTGGTGKVYFDRISISTLGRIGP